MALERYTYAGTQRLRCGYTTGSCAALAAKAATEGLLSGSIPAQVSLTTPSGVHLEVDVQVPERASDGTWARAGVRKDAGDDVDATDGLLIVTEVRLIPQSPASGPGEPNPVVILGGTGVGLVTRPGLERPVGEAAINSVPRAMIASCVREVCTANHYSGGVEVTVSVPQGAEVARRTFNPHLGIEGGISILGTTGIVEPRSVQALTQSTELEIRQIVAEGGRNLVLVPGNYGQDFVRSTTELAELPVVTFSNYLGDALDACARQGLERVLLVGHVGKLAKVAAGVMNTHSRVADCRLEPLCAHAAMAGASPQIARALMSCATTDAALDMLDQAGLLQQVNASLVEAVAMHISRRAAGAFQTAAIMFSRERGELARSSHATQLIQAMLEKECR